MFRYPWPLHRLARWLEARRANSLPATAARVVSLTSTASPEAGSPPYRVQG